MQNYVRMSATKPVRYFMTVNQNCAMKQARLALAEHAQRPVESAVSNIEQCAKYTVNAAKRAIIDLPAKCYLIGVSLVGRWWLDAVSQLTVISNKAQPLGRETPARSSFLFICKFL